MSEGAASSDASVASDGVGGDVLEALLQELFRSVSSLKLACESEQPLPLSEKKKKTTTAKNLVAIAPELSKLLELKQRFKGLIGAFGGGQMELVEAGTLQRKTEEIVNLQEKIKEITASKEQLEKRIRRMEKRQKTGQKRLSKTTLYEDSPTVQLLESSAATATAAAGAFTRLLMSKMASAGWDMEAAARTIEPETSFAKPSHFKYAFLSYVMLRMFNGFENENFYMDGSLSSILDPVAHRRACFAQFKDMLYMEPSELLSVTPDCLFGRFCHKKFLAIVHPRMDDAFFDISSSDNSNSNGNGDRSLKHRVLVQQGAHPRTQFYQSFLQLGKSIWLLHRLAFSFQPNTARVFQVRKGAHFSAAFMTTPVRNIELNSDHNSAVPTNVDSLIPEVGFTIIPGFRIDDSTAVKCQVYLNHMKPTN